MLMNSLIALVVILAVFFGYVSTREGKFYYERSGVINASPEKIFPYISNLKMGELWSPYEKIDPNLKKTFTGLDAQVGSKMKFAGNSKAGSGSIEILEIVPNKSVKLRLIMTAPIKAENIVEYKLAAEGSATRFSWAMHGDGGYFNKLITLIIDCEKMIAGQFTEGINNLKAVVEANNKA